MAINPLILPDQDALPIEGIRKILSGLRLFAENLDVKNESSFNKITSIYSEAKNWEKIIDNQRKEANAPDQSRINARNDRAKEVAEPLKGIIAVCKLKADSYQRFLEEEKRKESEQITKAALIFDDVVPYIEPLNKTQRGEGAMAVSKDETRWRVIDLEQVPRQYLMLDEQKIKLSLKMGVANIPGIEVYVEKVTQLRKR